MKVVLIIVFIAVTVSATFADSEQEVQRSNCQSCYEAVYSTIIGCSMWGSTDWIGCAEEVLGPDHPCTPCICDLIGDICLDLGCNLSC